MEIAVVGATAAVTIAGGRWPGRGGDHGARSHDQARPGGRGGADRLRRGADSVGDAARAAAAAAEPISDVRASADYRRAMAEVVARRVITAAVARARGETVPVPASSAVFAAGGAS